MRKSRQSTPFFMRSALRRKLTYRWTPGRKTASRVAAYPLDDPQSWGHTPDESSMSPALKHIKGVVRLPTASLQRFAEARPITGRAFCYRGYRQDEYRTVARKPWRVARQRQ